MTFEEFETKDLKLQEQISDLRLKNLTLSSDININERKIVRLEMDRVQLCTEYAIGSVTENNDADTGQINLIF